MEDRRNNPIGRLGYEDTNVKYEVDIYGIVFEINNLETNIERLQNVNRNDEKSIEEVIKIILGENSIDRLREKRLKDNEGELTITHELGILLFLMKMCRKAYAEKQRESIDEIINMGNRNSNRQERRQYNKQNSYKNRGYYGRNKRY